jgi:hypothetical protein
LHFCILAFCVGRLFASGDVIINHTEWSSAMEWIICNPLFLDMELL